MESHLSDIMTLIAQAPWREAVTYRDTWPHEYVFIQKDKQQDLLSAFSRVKASNATSSTRHGHICF